MIPITQLAAFSVALQTSAASRLRASKPTSSLAKPGNLTCLVGSNCYKTMWSNLCCFSRGSTCDGTIILPRTCARLICLGITHASLLHELEYQDINITTCIKISIRVQEIYSTCYFRMLKYKGRDMLMLKCWNLIDVA